MATGKLVAGVGALLAVTVLALRPVSGRVELRWDWPIEPAPKPIPPRRAEGRQLQHYRALRWYVLARCLEKDHRLLDAVTAYEKALALEPDAPAIYRALIPLCFHLERDEQALAYCRKALAIDPDDYELRFQYGCELRTRGETKKALKEIERAVQVDAARQQPALLAQMYFTLATLYEDEGELVQAADAYTQVCRLLDASRAFPTQLLDDDQRNREIARTYERLGRVWLRAGEFNKAVRAYRQAQQKDPTRAARLDFHLAELYAARKDYAPAYRHLRNYLATRPGGVEPYRLLVDVLRGLGREKEIVPALEAASKADPFNLPLKFLLARQYAASGGADRAEKIYLAALEDYPTEEAYRGLAELYAAQGRWDELVARLDHDLSDPRHLPSARQQLHVLTEEPPLLEGVGRSAAQQLQAGKRLHLQTRRALTALTRQAGLYDLAEVFCRACLEDDPDPGRVYVELCRILNRAGKYEAEAKVCREALTKDLSVPRSLFQTELARSLALGGKVDEAIAAARQAVQATPPRTADRFQAEFILAVAYHRGGKSDEALAVCRKLLAQANDRQRRRQVHYLTASIHTARREFADAEKHLREVLAIDPEDAAACNDLGYILADQNKNLEEAEQLIRRAISRDRADRARRRHPLEKSGAAGDNAAYVDSLGWVLYRLGRFDEAVRELERAVQLTGGDADPVLWDHLGQVYHALNRLDEAADAWERALRLYRSGRRQDAAKVKELSSRLRRLRIRAANPPPDE